MWLERARAAKIQKIGGRTFLSATIIGTRARISSLVAGAGRARERPRARLWPLLLCAHDDAASGARAPKVAIWRRALIATVFRLLAKFKGRAQIREKDDGEKRTQRALITTTIVVLEARCDELRRQRPPPSPPPPSPPPPSLNHAVKLDAPPSLGCFCSN